MASERRLVDANALPLMKFVGPKTEYHMGWNDALDAAASQAPDVDAVEVIHGRWIDRTNNCNGYVDYRYDCSVCGHIFWLGGFDSLNYCPNCGARMDMEAGERGEIE